jgi:mono/diheme cytochrome c family protein
MDKKLMKFYGWVLGLILVALFMLCKDRQKPGRIYCPDMAYSNAKEANGESDIATKVKGTSVLMASRMPVAGTIPMGTIPQNDQAKSDAYVYGYTYQHHFANTDEDKAKAGAMLKNPYASTPEVLKQGENAYNTYCSVCHGKGGLGDGPLIIRADGSDGAFKAIPPAYAERLASLRDGEIFHSITYGKGMMGGHASQVSASDRWKIILYIKKLGGIGEAGAVVASADTTKK